MYIAIDIGGSNTRVGIMDEELLSTYAIADQFATQAFFQAEMERIIKSLDSLAIGKPSGIGISMGAQVSRDGAAAFSALNMPDYEGKPITRILEKRFKCPVRMAHDTVCGLVAETCLGSLKNVDRCAYVTVSTGTGAAVRLQKGHSHVMFSVEFGHQILADNALKCICGQTGCLETITGGRQIEMRLGKTPAQIDDAQFWETFTEYLAVGIVNLSWLARVDIISVGGAIALNSPYVREHLAECVSKRRTRGTCNIVWSKFGTDSPLVGAALLYGVREASILH